MVKCNTSRCVPIHIPHLMKNINRSLESLKKVSTCKFKSEYIKIIEESRYYLIKVILEIQANECKPKSLPTKEDMLRQIFEYDYETKLEDIKTTHIRNEWTCQQRQMAVLQDSLFKKNRLLSLHSRYCSTQGNALSSVIALLMEKDEVVELFLNNSDKYLINFIKIADGSLASFIRSYAGDIPIADSTDYRFVLFLYTCIAFLTNATDGRFFMIKNNECQHFMYELIRCVPRITYSTCQTLKVELLKIMHNISKEHEGSAMLHLSEDLLTTLNDCIIQQYNVQTFKYLLEILEEITKDIPNTEYLNKFNKVMDMDRIAEFRKSEYTEIYHIPPMIFKNISVATTYLQKKEATVEKIHELPERLYPIKENPTTSKIRIRHIIKLNRSDGNTTSSVTYTNSTADTSSTGVTKALCFEPCKDMFELERFPLSYPSYPTHHKSQRRKSDSCSGTNSGTSTSVSEGSSERGYSSASVTFNKTEEEGRKGSTGKMKKSKCRRKPSSTSSSKGSSSNSGKRSSSGKYRHKKSKSKPKIPSPSSCVCCKSEQLLSSKSYSLPADKKPKYSNRATSCNFLELERISKQDSSISSLSDNEYNDPMLIEEVLYVDSCSCPIVLPDADTTINRDASNSNTGSFESATENKQLVPWTNANRQLTDLQKPRRKNRKTTPGTVRIVSRIVDVKPGCQQRVVTRVRIPNLRYEQQ